MFAVFKFKDPKTLPDNEFENLCESKMGSEANQFLQELKKTECGPAEQLKCESGIKKFNVDSTARSPPRSPLMDKKSPKSLVKPKKSQFDEVFPQNLPRKQHRNPPSRSTKSSVQPTIPKKFGRKSCPGKSTPSMGKQKLLESYFSAISGANEKPGLEQGGM